MKSDQGKVTGFKRYRRENVTTVPGAIVTHVKPDQSNVSGSKKYGKKNVTVVHGTIVTDWREQTVNSPCVRDAYQAVGDGSKEDYHSWK